MHLFKRTALSLLMASLIGIGSPVLAAELFSRLAENTNPPNRGLRETTAEKFCQDLTDTTRSRVPMRHIAFPVFSRQVDNQSNSLASRNRFEERT